MTEYLRKGELLPIKGYDTSVPSIFMKDGYAFPSDMHYEEGEMRRRDGKSRLGYPSIGNAKVLHLDTFKLTSLVTRLMMHTRTNVHKYNTSSEAFEDVTGADLTGEDTDFFDSTTVTEQDLYIYTQFIDNVRKCDDVGVSRDLGGNPQKAKFCEYVTPYLLLANLSENGLHIPTKLKWSDTGNPEVWDDGNAGSILLTADPSPIRRVKKLGNNFFTYKAGMVYRGSLVSTSDVFLFQILSTGQGLFAPRAITEANEGHFYMGNSDFHFNDGVRIQDIGGPIRERVFGRLNTAAFQACWTMHVAEFKEVWFFIATSTSTLPNEIWKYKYDLGFWYRDTAHNLMTGTNYNVTKTVAWKDLIGTWLEQTWRWGDRSGQAAAPVQVFGDDRGLVLQRDPRIKTDYEYDVVGVLESRDYSGLGKDPGIEFDQEWLQLDFWASGNTVDVYYSIDFGDTWKLIETKTLTNSMKKYTSWFHVISPQIRFKFVNGDENGFFKIRSFVSYYLDQAEVPGP